MNYNFIVMMCTDGATPELGVLRYCNLSFLLAFISRHFLFIEKLSRETKK